MHLKKDWQNVNSNTFLKLQIRIIISGANFPSQSEVPTFHLHYGYQVTHLSRRGDELYCGNISPFVANDAAVEWQYTFPSVLKSPSILYFNGTRVSLLELFGRLISKLYKKLHGFI